MKGGKKGDTGRMWGKREDGGEKGMGDVGGDVGWEKEMGGMKGGGGGNGEKGYRKDVG